MENSQLAGTIHDDDNDDESELAGVHFRAPSFLHRQSIRSEEHNSPTEENEAKRHVLRQALANRLRFDLVQQEEEKEFKQHYDRFARLDRQLKQAESQAKARYEQEKATTEILKKQQATIAKAIQSSKIN